MMHLFRPLRWILVAASAALLISCSGSGDGGGVDNARSPETPSSGETAKPSSGITFRTLEGTKKNLSEYSGKILLVNYMASWHADSRKLVPIMNNVQVKFRNHVTVIGVITDEGGVGPARMFKNQNDVRFELLLPDRDARTNSAMRKLPTTIAYTRDGSVYAKYSGLYMHKKYEDLIVSMYARRM